MSTINHRKLIATLSDIQIHFSLEVAFRSSLNVSIWRSTIISFYKDSLHWYLVWDYCSIHSLWPIYPILLPLIQLILFYGFLFSYLPVLCTQALDASWQQHINYITFTSIILLLLRQLTTVFYPSGPLTQPVQSRAPQYLPSPLKPAMWKYQVDCSLSFFFLTLKLNFIRSKTLELVLFVVFLYWL